MPQSSNTPRNFDDLSESALIPVRLVADLLSVSSVTVWRWVQSGKLPKPRKIGANSTRWRVSEIREALDNLTA